MVLLLSLDIPKGIPMLRLNALNQTVQQNETSIISEEKQDEYVVPNNVHYVWYSDTKKEFRFQQYLSVLSVYKFQKPDNIYFHTNNPPSGKYCMKYSN